MKPEPGDFLDDLQINGWRYWQNKNYFCGGTDGVLLAAFCRCLPEERVMDLCAGAGIAAFSLLAEGRASSVVAVEIQPYLCELMCRSAVLNGCADRLTVLEGDLTELPCRVSPATFDMIAANPPYLKQGAGKPSANAHREIARREILCDLPGIVRVSAYLLKPGGRLNVIYPPERMEEFRRACAAAGFYIARESKAHPKRVLCEAVRRIEPDLSSL